MIDRQIVRGGGLIIVHIRWLAPAVSALSGVAGGGLEKREGMGQPNYHLAMPFLRDVAHDGVLRTLNNSQPKTGTSVVARQGSRLGPSIT